MKTDPLLQQVLGNFWQLQNRLRDGHIQPIWVVSCVETATAVDRLLAPAQPLYFSQNGGGTCTDLLMWCDSIRSRPRDLIVVVHQNCNFCQGRSPEDVLMNRFRELCHNPKLRSIFERKKTNLHLWSLDRQGYLQVYCPVVGRCQSPIAMMN